MILHHTTYRRLCPSIAVNGLTDGKEGCVCLTPHVWSWHYHYFMQLAGIYEIWHDEVVLAYDVPEDVAAAYLTEPKIAESGDPDYDPEIEDYNPDVDKLWVEYRMPAEVVNKYFAGVSFWHGQCPFDSDAMKLLWKRRFG